MLGVFRNAGRCVALILLSGALAFSQTASVSGTVVDSSQAAVPDAKITATNLATNLERSTQTATSGAYSLPNLAPGKYTITIEKAGFATARFEGVELTVAQIQTLNVTLEVGTVNATIDVSGETVTPIELETAQISNVVDQKRIVDLPLIVRDPYSLILLAPGVVQTNSGLGGFSVNGSRERNNNFLLDGADNNDTSVPGIPGGLISLNPESTQEFRVITNNFLPEFGRNTGAIVDVITRSGTNDLHGDAYWFGRYNAMAARDYFNTTPNPQDPFERNQFGWSLGGPVIKNRTFFFVNNEYQRFNTTLRESTVVPTAAFKTGKFTFDGFNVNLADANSPNNAQQIPLDPTVQKLLALLPNPNGESVDDVRGIYRFPSSSRQHFNAVNFKVDQRITDKHNLFLRYSYNGFTDPDPFHDEFIQGLGATGTDQQTHSLAAGLVSALRPTLVNEFRFGVNRVADIFSCGNRTAFDSLSTLDPFGNGSDYAISGIATVGCAALGDTNAQFRKTGTWLVNDSIAVIKSSHSFKFGGEFRNVFENGDNAFGSRTYDSFNGYTTFGVPIANLDPNNPCDPNTGNNCGGRQFQDMASGLLGLVDFQSQYQYFDKSGNRRALDFLKFRQHEYGVYAQDSWKIRSNLTLSYGLRYQFNGVPFEVNNNLSNLFANPQGAAPFTFSIVGPGTGKLLYNNDPHNFEPRVGLSWDPFKNGKTAFRAGYGIFHDRIFGNLFGNARTNPPFVQQVQNFPGDILANVPTPATVPTSPTVTDGAFLSPTLFAPNLKIPYSQNWNAGIQRELPLALTLEANYVGSKGTRELRAINSNQPLPALVNALIAQGTSPDLLQSTALYVQYPTTLNTALYEPGTNESVGNSTYNSLQFKVTRKFVHGVEIQGAYTWAHAIDDASDPLVAAAGNRNFPRNSFNLHEERGQADFDVRQRLSVNYIMELPFGKGRAYLHEGAMGRILEGWQFAGITTVQDGLPYDIFGNRDSEHTALSSRASLVGSPAIPAGSDRTQTGPPVSAFALAAFGGPGNLGRNTFVGPGLANWDLVLSKTQSLTEHVRLQFRFEFYNLFNRVEFTQPGNLIYDPGTFGLSTGTGTRPDGTSSNRQIQVAMKLHF
ncbi:MAG: TonB-dependent receptor [Acidobacteriia bacterium]|nr:TonB-dependent receptor [Terriglobia bacterium]